MSNSILQKYKRVHMMKDSMRIFLQKKIQLKIQFHKNKYPVLLNL